MAGSSGIYQSEFVALEKKLEAMSKWQDKVAKEFNRSFNEPFMPDGFCKASVGDGVLRINLGDRDVAFDQEGNPIGSGSNVGDAIQWEISKKGISKYLSDDAKRKIAKKKKEALKLLDET